MTYPIIKTDNYLLVVDESEIKDCYYWNELDREIRKNNNINHSYHKKIIFHLPLNNALILEGVPLLPPLEDESIFFAEQETIKNEWNSEKSFKAGYNKAKEKYKYTEEDLRKAIEMAKVMGYGDSATYPMPDVYDEEEIIQSLQQPKYPVAFECEIDNILSYNADDGINALINLNFGKPKTITNSQGLTQLVGKYIY